MGPVRLRVSFVWDTAGQSCDTEMDVSEAFEQDGNYYCGQACVTEGHPVKTTGCGKSNCCQG
jgi:hypothetical protein